MPLPAKIVGIVNVTPDSFSDGGRYNAPEAALAHISTLLEAGADVIDIGAESTRPGAESLSPDDEWQRLQAVLCQARQQFPQAVISIDTRHAKTAKWALEAGADWINDVSGAADPAMPGTIAQYAGCRYVLMHALRVPVDPQQTLPEGTDVVSFMVDWFTGRRALLQKAGVEDAQLIFDPGIGFGKTAEQSWEIIRRMPEIGAKFNIPLLAGHSRKSFLKAVAPEIEAARRDLETHVVSAALAQSGVAYLRVHDVAGTRRVLAVANALQSGE